MKKRIIILLSVLLVIAFIVVSYTCYLVAHDSLSQQLVHKIQPLTGDNVYSEIQHDLLRPILISSVMAQNVFVRNWVINGEVNEQVFIDYLREIKLRYGAQTSFFVSEKTRKYYHSGGIVKTVNPSDRQDDWYFNARTLPSDQDYEINIDTDSVDSSNTIVYVNYKMKDYNNQFIGLIGIGLSLQKVQVLIEQYQIKYNRTVYFMDQSGLITLSGSAYKGPVNLFEKQSIAPLSEQILNKGRNQLSYQDNNQSIYLNSRFVPEFKWYLIVEQTGFEGQEIIKHTLWGNIFLGLMITAVLMFIANRILGNYQNQLETLATTDGLTQTSTRQVLDSYFMDITTKPASVMSLILLDIDDFKKVNDTYGHNAGDRIIKAISEILLSGRRENDLTCRWGGEEFILLLPNTTLSLASEIAERLRILIASKVITVNDIDISISASFGVAERFADEAKVHLINRADMSLYHAKNQGKNRVVASSV